jgi:hypothetical protein
VLPYTSPFSPRGPLNRTPPYKGVRRRAWAYMAERAWAYTSVHLRTWPSVHRRAGGCRGVHARAYKGVHPRTSPYKGERASPYMAVHGRAPPCKEERAGACMPVHARTRLHRSGPPPPPKPFKRRPDPLKGAPPRFRASLGPLPQMNREARPFPFRGSSGVRGPQSGKTRISKERGAF